MKRKRRELLEAIIAGPVRPLTKEDQDAEDEHLRRSVAVHQQWADALGISLERVNELYLQNPIRLIERVALAKLGNAPERRRRLRALMAAR